MSRPGPSRSLFALVAGAGVMLGAARAEPPSPSQPPNPSAALPDAAPQAESPPLALVDRWLDAQNQGDFAAYQALYAATFEGVRRSGPRVLKLDRAGWIKDRERMFKNKMTVAADDRKVTSYGSGYRVTFTQTWASGKYKDVGTKELILREEAGELRIFREELLESIKDLGIKGSAFLVWDAGTPDTTEAALAASERIASLLATVVEFAPGFPTRLEGGGVDGIAPKEAVVVLGVCTPVEAATVIDLFKQLGSKVTVRETTWKPKGQGTSCPTFYRDPESAGRGWSWPGTAASAPLGGGDTLTVVALRREDAELGDFAREYQENLFLAVVAGRDGAIKRSAAFKGGSDFAELQSIERHGAAVVASERYVDRPCDGTDKHRYQVIVQALRFELKDGDIEKLADDREIAERGRCSDAEKQLYR